MVEADDAETPARKPFAEQVRPAGKRSVQPMDEKDRRVAVASQAFISDVDSIGADGGHHYPCEFGGGPLSEGRNRRAWYDPLGSPSSLFKAAAPLTATFASSL